MGALGLRSHLTGVVIPLAAAAAVGIRYQFANGVTFGLLVSLALVPVWLSSLANYRGARLLLTLGSLATAAGVALTLADPYRETSTTLLVRETLGMAAVLGIIGTLLWVRSLTNGTLAAGAFGAGMLVSVFLVGGNQANLWKYSLSLPVIVIVLALAANRGRRGIELAMLVALSAVSLISDARSLTSTLALTGVLVLWQMRSPDRLTLRPRPWMTLATLGVLAYAAYQVMQALMLEGVLGEAAQQRTQAQLDMSGSLLTGGRPEIGAALTLIGHQPWGFGSGTLPTSNDVWLAKAGMSALNYNPNNGYVESFMFGTRFEVHSVLGDMWLRFGPTGAAFALLAVGICIYGLAVRVSSRSASALLIYIVLVAGWNLLFGPLGTSDRPLALAVAVALLPARQPTPEPEWDAMLRQPLVRGRPDRSAPRNHLVR